MTMPPTRYPLGLFYMGVEPDADGNLPTPDELHAEAAKTALAARKDASQALVAADREYVREIESRIESQGRVALDSLEALIVEADTLLRTEWESLTGEPESWTAKSKVLTSLVRRCCVAAREILILSRASLSWGAQARWRTLNELAITAEFVNACDESISERYLEWRAVEAWKERKELRVAQESVVVMGFLERGPDIDLVLEQEYQRIRAREGKMIKNDWGWATPALARTPSFGAIEDAVKGAVLKKQAHFAVHASPGSFFRSEDPNDALRFPNDQRGLVAPGANSTRELKRAFIAYGDNAFRVGRMPGATMLWTLAFMDLCDETLKSFAAAAGFDLSAPDDAPRAD